MMLDTNIISTWMYIQRLGNPEITDDIMCYRELQPLDGVDSRSLRPPLRYFSLPLLLYFVRRQDFSCVLRTSESVRAGSCCRLVVFFSQIVISFINKRILRQKQKIIF